MSNSNGSTVYCFLKSPTKMLLRHPSPTCSFIPLDHSYYQLLSHIPAPTSFREFSEVVVKYKERHLEMKPLEFLAAASILCTCLQTAASK
ncbi:hypothetical protein DAI22_04g137000 [Oryza sativa Japonica Group]|nr:hypothetical protein DAI22_04g137000 [Oryza sativa Japonica Group]